jgi:hypothetical protein
MPQSPVPVPVFGFVHPMSGWKAPGGGTIWPPVPLGSTGTETGVLATVDGFGLMVRPHP